MVAKHDRDIEHGKVEHGKDEPLNGTFVSVLILGAFIVVCWVGIFLLFIDRA